MRLPAYDHKKPARDGTTAERKRRELRKALGACIPIEYPLEPFDHERIHAQLDRLLRRIERWEREERERPMTAEKKLKQLSEKT